MNTVSTIPDGFTRKNIAAFAVAALASLSILVPVDSRAQSTWVGATSSDWSDGSNWNPIGVPSGADASVNTSSGNLATVSTDVSSQVPNLLKVGDGVIGILNVQSGGNLTINSETWIGNGLGHGTLNISGGNLTPNSWFAVGRGGGQGTVNMTDGIIVKNANNNFAVGIDNGSVGVFNQSGGSVSSDGEIWIGNSGGANGQYNLSGTGSLTANNWFALGRSGGIGVLNMSGGTLVQSGNNHLLVGADNPGPGIINQTGGTVIANASDTYIGGFGGTGIWNLNGGSANLSRAVICEAGGVTGTLNLNTNGTLTATEITTDNAGSTSTLNFNGGVLSAVGDSATFLHDLTVANVRNGGVIIDDGGFMVNIAQSLAHSAVAGDNATDGGLIKKGTGTLELSGASSYTGPTIIEAGILELDLVGSSHGSIYITNGALLNLTFSGTALVSGLYTNGVALPPGVYSSSNLGSFIVGTGLLMVSPGISTGVWDGGGANNNWSTGGNWDQDATPIFPIGLTFAGSTKLANNNDLTGITVNGFTFNAAAGAFVIGGNDITLAGNIGFTANPSSPVTQAINLNFGWSINATIDTPTNGNLTLGGNITSTNNLTKLGNGTLKLGGADLFAGYSLDGGTNIITGNVTVNGTGGSRFYVGDGDAVSQCLGTLDIENGGTLTVTGGLADSGVLGRDSGSGRIIQNGGIFNFNPTNQNALFVGATGDGHTRSEYDMNGGLLNLNYKTLGVSLGNGVMITGVVSQVNGVITNVDNLQLGALFGIGHGTYTLNGGSIYIGTNGITTITGSYDINLGGGTVGAYVNWTSALNMNLTGINGPVKFDTAANTVSLSGALSGDGGLTKFGSGTLELASSGNTYAGDTTVNGGVLQLDVAHSSTNVFRLANKGMLNLNFGGTYIVATLYTNNVALPGGIYNAGNLGAFIAGAGSMQVSAVAFTGQPQNQTIYLNGNLHRSVTLTSATMGGAATYQWYLNGNPISGATGSNLTLSNLQMANGGNYFVVASGGFGSITSSVAAVTIYGENNNLFAYDGFDYPGSVDASTPIDGSSQNGGFGWAIPWTGAGGTTANTAIGVGSLIGGANVPAGFDARSIGNSIEDFGTSRVGRFFDTSTNSELSKQGFIDGSGNIGADGKTIYLSFLLQSSVATSFYEMELKRGDLGDPGRIGGIGNDTGSANINLRAGNVNNYSLGAGDTGVDLYVIRIDYQAGNDNVFVYRNPVSITEPSTPTLTVSNAANMSFNGLTVAAFGGPDLKADEIRLGATWADAIGLAVSNLLPPTKTANGFAIQFAATPNYSYRIQRATSLTGSWTDISTNIAPANAFIQYTDTNAPVGAAFYRTVTP